MKNGGVTEICPLSAVIWWGSQTLTFNQTDEAYNSETDDDEMLSLQIFPLGHRQ